MIISFLITGQECPEWNLPVKASANFTRAWSCRFEYRVKNQSSTKFLRDEMQASVSSRSSYLQQSLLHPMLIRDKRLALGSWLLAIFQSALIRDPR